MECTSGQIVAQKKVTPALLLKVSRNAGKSPSTAIARDISGNKGHAELSLRAGKLDDKGLFSKPDPLLELRRINDDQSKQLVYRTEVVKNDLSPTWQPFKVSLSSLCRREEPRPLMGLVWDYDSCGKHDFIAEFSTTFVEMQNALREDQVRAGRARLSPRMRWGAGPALGCPRNCCDGFREAKDGDRAGHPHPPGGWSRDHQPVLKLK
ncbi:copine-7-like [Delphinapterus leucas]|uniref:Copine-7-like n=1 Tax=Delphinapterus leucas TaxID=9749 RepID=A0A2Y9P006_DELLE|nr:copine-7-like [Delphinapterus leucas]